MPAGVYCICTVPQPEKSRRQVIAVPSQPSDLLTIVSAGTAMQGYDIRNTFELSSEVRALVSVA